MAYVGRTSKRVALKFNRCFYAKFKANNDISSWPPINQLFNGSIALLFLMPLYGNHAVTIGCYA